MDARGGVYCGMRGTSLLVAVLVLCVAPAVAEEIEGCGGQTPEQAAPEFCKLLSRPPLDGDPQAAAAHRACLAYYRAVTGGIDRLCVYRDRVLAVDARPAAHQEWVGRFGGLISDVETPFNAYKTSLDALIEKGKALRRQEHQCRGSAQEKPSLSLLAVGAFSMEQALVSRNLVGERLSLWRSHAQRSAALNAPGGLIKADSRVAARVFVVDPRGDVPITGAVPVERDANPSAGTRQLHQGIAIAVGQKLNLLPQSVAVLGVAFNLNARRDLRGYLDTGDIISVLGPAALGLVVGRLTTPQVGSGVALISGAVADNVEGKIRGEDLTVRVIKEYPPFAVKYLTGAPQASSYEVSRAFHESIKSGLCSASHPGGP